MAAVVNETIVAKKKRSYVRKTPTKYCSYMVKRRNTGVVEPCGKKCLKDVCFLHTENVIKLRAQNTKNCMKKKLKNDEARIAYNAYHLNYKNTHKSLL